MSEISTRPVYGDEQRTETHYAVHYRSRSGQHITEYGPDLDALRRDFTGNRTVGTGSWRVTQKLLTRAVKIGPWKAANDAALSRLILIDSQE